jgi:hypothetical protein
MRATSVRERQQARRLSAPKDVARRARSYGHDHGLGP